LFSKLIQRNTEYLKKLVIDTIIWNLDTKSALNHIEKIGKKKISERYYFKLKKQVLSDEEIENWINDYAAYGFILIHKMDIEETLRIKNSLLEIYYHETSKPYLIPTSKNGKNSKIIIRNPDYDVNLVMKLASQITEYIKILTEMYIGTPIMHALQQKMKQDSKQSPFHLKQDILQTS